MAKSSKKLKIGHVQDTPVSTSMISNECMICHMKVHIVSYNLDQKKFSKSKIHILPNYEQTNLKTAIVITWESRCSSEIKVWGHLCQILVFIEVPWSSKLKGCLEIAKGQIISKAIFVFLTSPKKRTKTIWLVIS
mgnify:CR=1 FL=1